jgi:hypothetical protein
MIVRSLYCTNKAAINITHNSIQHNQTKHIEIDRHFIKEKLQARLIFTTPYVKTGKQLANILAKGVFSSVLHLASGKLGMQDIFATA